MDSVEKKPLLKKQNNLDRSFTYNVLMMLPAIVLFISAQSLYIYVSNEWIQHYLQTRIFPDDNITSSSKCGEVNKASLTISCTSRWKQRPPCGRCSPATHGTHHTVQPNIIPYNRLSHRSAEYHTVQRNITTYSRISHRTIEYHTVKQNITTYSRISRFFSSRARNIRPQAYNRYHTVQPNITFFSSRARNIRPQAYNRYHTVQPNITPE